MKKIILVLLTAMLVAGISCKKSHSGSYTPSCTGTTPKFSTDAGPLIASSCATSGCHASGSSNGPGALTNYTQIKSASAAIRSAVVDGSMPENSTLSTAQRNSIVCWIDGGAAND
jgi:hypothetical protein